MKPANETKAEFLTELRALLAKYSATLDINETLVRGGYDPDYSHTLNVSIPYTYEGCDCTREGVEIDLASRFSSTDEV